MRNSYKILWIIRNGGDYLRDRIRLQDNMNINLRGIDFEVVNFIYVIKDRFLCLGFVNAMTNFGRSQWPNCLRRWFAVARLLRFWFRIPPEAWKSVCCECCVLSSRGLSVGLITRPEESY